MAKEKSKEIVKLIKTTVVIEGKGEYELCDPSFPVLSLALSKLMQIQGDNINSSMVDAGKVIFDACYVGDDLEVIQKDPVLYLSICMQCASIIEVYKGELKKN